MDKLKALEKLEELIGRTENQLNGQDEESFDRWKRAASVGIRKIFGDSSEHVNEFKKIRYSLGIFTSDTPESAFRAAKIGGIKNALELLKSLSEEIQEYWDAIEPVSAQEEVNDNYDYINIDRLAELKALTSSKFDFSRLVRICEEINIANKNGCFITVGALIRILIDHVPPILGFDTFKMVASSYPGKSLKETFSHLENGSRKVSDGLIHQSIRKKESLPNLTQVNYSANIDVLLSEVIRRIHEDHP